MSLVFFYHIKQPADRHIYERGCLRASEDWLEGNLAHVAGSYVSVMVLQVNNNLLKQILSFQYFFDTLIICSISSSYIEENDALIWSPEKNGFFVSEVIYYLTEIACVFSTVQNSQSDVKECL